MRLLFDENLSHQLVRLLTDIFPQSVHVRDVGLKSADDPVVWQYAKETHLIIVLEGLGPASTKLRDGPSAEAGVGAIG